ADDDDGRAGAERLRGGLRLVFEHAIDNRYVDFAEARFAGRDAEIHRAAATDGAIDLDRAVDVQFVQETHQPADGEECAGAGGNRDGDRRHVVDAGVFRGQAPPP